MQKIGAYLILLVTGALIGVSFVSYFTLNPNSSLLEQVKVTIQGIDYTSDDSVLEIELLNDVPEKNLEGIIIVSQHEKQWTGNVNWAYTGYGKAEIICDSIDETQNVNIQYQETNSKATYLDRTIEWNEVVGQHFTFMETEELKITSVTSRDSTSLTVNLINTGTTDVTITSVSVSGSGVTGAALSSATVVTGGTGSFDVTITGELVSGLAYKIELLSSKGNTFSYTSTMSLQGSSTSQTGAVLTVENVRFYTSSNTDYIEFVIRNSGTAGTKIVEIYAGTSSSALTIQSSVTYNPSTQMVSGGSSLSVTVQYDWTEGTRYYFKMVTEAGQTLPFSELA